MSDLWNRTMKEIDAVLFKELCPDILDELGADGLIVTKDGKPFARVVPYETGGADLIGSLSHKVKIRGDVFSTGLSWDTKAQS